MGKAAHLTSSKVKTFRTATLLGRFALCSPLLNFLNRFILFPLSPLIFKLILVRERDPFRRPSPLAQSRLLIIIITVRKQAHLLLLVGCLLSFKLSQFIFAHFALTIFKIAANQAVIILLAHIHLVFVRD